MGWKNVKKHYGLKYIVKMSGEDLHIGSPYVGDLIKVSPEGVATVNRTFASANDLVAISDAINSDRQTFIRLMALADTFETSIAVFTWKGAEIIKESCEELGYPNVTHQGNLMYDNTYFTDPLAARRRAIADAKAGVEGYRERVEETEKRLAEFRAEHDRCVADVAALEAGMPATVEA